MLFRKKRQFKYVERLWRRVQGDAADIVELELFCSSPNRGIPVQESDGNGNHFQSSSAEHRSTGTQRTCGFHYPSGASAPRKQMVGDSCATCRDWIQKTLRQAKQQLIFKFFLLRQQGKKHSKCVTCYTPKEYTPRPLHYKWNLASSWENL